MRTIARRLKGVPVRLTADVGCGTGRYARHLLQTLPARATLICLDYNERMLRHLRAYLRSMGLRGYAAVRARAESLPLPNACLDALFTFNALHHFDGRHFFAELERVLRPGGLAFLYTRFRSQNRRNLWGRFFPGFAAKETRLYERHELQERIHAQPALHLEGLHYFVYHRKADLATLLHRARHHCYSTFALYEPGEFRRSLAEFERTLLRHFSDPGDIRWVDENVMAIVRKTGP